MVARVSMAAFRYLCCGNVGMVAIANVSLNSSTTEGMEGVVSGNRNDDENYVYKLPPPVEKTYNTDHAISSKQCGTQGLGYRTNSICSKGWECDENNNQLDHSCSYHCLYRHRRY